MFYESISDASPSSPSVWGCLNPGHLDHTHAHKHSDVSAQKHKDVRIEITFFCSLAPAKNGFKNASDML